LVNVVGGMLCYVFWIYIFGRHHWQRYATYVKVALSIRLLHSCTLLKGASDSTSWFWRFINLLTYLTDFMENPYIPPWNPCFSMEFHEFPMGYPWDISMRVLTLTYLKPLEGMRCHLTGTLVWSQVTLYWTGYPVPSRKGDILGSESPVSSDAAYRQFTLAFFWIMALL